MLFFSIAPARAVILYDRANRATSAPTGSYLDSGWQWQGQWGNFSGTVFNKKYFVTAEHIGGTLGQNFVFNGANYTATAVWDDPQSDLQVWKVNHLFKTWAPLYKGTSERGKVITIFGRGTQRGDPVVVNNQTKGWLWGIDDHLRSWGKNIVKGTATGQSDAENGAKNVKNLLLDWTFDAHGVAKEGAVSLGDSGGGVFAKIDNQWQLIGVNYSTEGNFTIPGEVIERQGAIFDFGGLEMGSDLVPDGTGDVPAHSYATRISARAKWLDDIIHGRVAPSDKLVTAPVPQGVPEPTCVAFLAIGALLLGQRH